MSLTREDLKAQLRRGQIAPVYLLYGPETHLRDIASKYISDLVFESGELRDFNETVFSLNTEGNLRRALAAAEQLPMMAKRRVIRVTDIRISATGHRDTIVEDDEATLAAYLDNPSPHTVLIFIADELNGNRKMAKLLKTNSIAVEFGRLDDRQLTEWARGKITEAGAEIDPAALRRLVELVGVDVRRLTNEINKLAAAALPGPVITKELVEALVPFSREIDNFALTDHLVAGRRSMALATLKKILDDGSEPLALLGLISYNYRRLLMAKEMMARGVERREVANVAKVRYSDQEPFLAAARRARMDDLTRALKSLAETDLAIKTSKGGGGPIGTRMQLEMLVCQLASF
jgi:DNA polymerase-3 subunit delta